MQKFDTEFDGYYFPEEIKAIPHWAVCYADKVPMYSPGFQKPLIKASPTDPSTWMTFETAEHLCDMYDGLLPGFILTQDDPFTVIDMDVKDNTPADHMTWFWQIAQGAASYTETSASGKGLHLWVYGNYGEGRRSSSYHIERYSQDRFIICTGNPVINVPIANGDGVCGYLSPYLDAKAKVTVTVQNLPQVKSDEEVISEINTWDNREKFEKLYFATPEYLIGVDYQSGSEADAALLNFLIKASPNNEQVMRIFRKTALANRGPKPGQKDKIMADDKYLLRTINGMRSYIAVEHEQKKAQAEAMIAMTQRNLDAMSRKSSEAEQETIRQQLAVRDAEFDVEKTEYSFPPGPLGELAKWVVNTSSFPVEVIAITTVLALASGLTAKGWTYREKHLNAYYIIAARSGTGKNALHQSLGKIIRRGQDAFGIDMQDIFCASEMRSAIAWKKRLLEQTNLCSILPEIGSLLSTLNTSGANNSADERKAFILEAYSGSHKGMLSGGAEYSNKENNITANKKTEPTLSIIGETTLDGLFDNLTGKLAADGFMSRFNYAIYEGYTVGRNLNQGLAIPDWIMEIIAFIFKLQAEYIQKGFSYEITETPEAAARLYEIQSYLGHKLGNETKMDDETLRQIYNRVQEKVERMAGTFAVFDNPRNPVIKIEHVEWCNAYVMSSVKLMLDRYKNGEIGELTDAKVRRSVVKAILKYFASDLGNTTQEYRYEELRQRKIFMQSSVQRRCYKQLARLETARYSEKPAKALSRILKELSREGFISEINEVEKACLASPQDGSKAIKIPRHATAWFIVDLEGLNDMLNDTDK